MGAWYLTDVFIYSIHIHLLFINIFTSFVSIFSPCGQIRVIDNIMIRRLIKQVGTSGKLAYSLGGCGHLLLKNVGALLQKDKTEPERCESWCIVGTLCTL